MFSSGCGFRVVLLLLVVTGFFVYLTYQDYSLGAYATTAPEEIRLQDLITRGPEGNPHVKVTDYELCNNLVYSHPKKMQPTSVWSKVWIPIIPQGSAEGEPGRGLTPRRVQAILVSNRIDREADIPSLAGPSLQGLVTNRITSLGSEEQNLLAKSYPETDFARCLIIEHERKPPSRTGMLVQGAAAAGCLALAAGIIGVGVWRNRRAEAPRPVVREQPSAPSKEDRP